MRRVEPPCEFGACQGIYFENGTFRFTTCGVEVWGEGSWISDDYGTHIEGKLLLPNPRLQAPVLVDIIEQPNYGIYTTRTTAVQLVEGWQTLLVTYHRSGKIESLRCKHVRVDEAYLTATVHQRGVLKLNRSGETGWGPKRFCGRETNAGAMTIYW